MVKKSASQCRRCGFNPGFGKIPLKKEMATHSNILAWGIPWIKEPGRLQSMGSQTAGRVTNTYFYTSLISVKHLKVSPTIDNWSSRD